MAKRQLLPPSTDAQKRVMSVNLRFSADVYERLKAVAEYSGTSIASLLFYVTVNTTLPMMEREMNKTKQAASPKKETSPPSDLVPDVAPRPVQE